MNKTCARCLKTVYPTEELKCLDKVWHKGCFKCQECGMTLNMRTYKGYGKLPYCEAHVPKIKATTMAETPELKRIAENTKIQSNVKYHADFEKSKGKCTQVANDPETLRITANSKIISNVAYHGDLEKKAAMEKQRTFADNGDVIDLPTTDNYHLQLDNYASEMLPPSVPPPAVPQQQNYSQINYSQKAPPIHQSIQNSNEIQHRQQSMQKQNDRIDYINSNNYNMAYGNHNQPSYNSNHSNSGPNVQISSYASSVPQNSIYDEYDNQNVDSGYQQQQHHQQRNYVHSYGDQYYQDRNVQQSQQQRIGRIADYDPLTDGPRNSPMPPVQGATVVYSSSQKYHHQPQQQQQQQPPPHSHPSNNGRIGGHHNSSGSRRIGSVADMDPLNDVYSSIAGQMPPHQQHMPPQHQTQMPPQHQQQMHPQHQQMSAKGNSNNVASGKVYIAMYDYEAADSDEVSFREGDFIVNVSAVDEGWMTGRVQRTGVTGMLPANYVELAQI